MAHRYGALSCAVFGALKSVFCWSRCHRKRVAQIVVAQWRRFVMLRRAADRGACHRRRWLLRAGLQSLRSAAAQV